MLRAAVRRIERNEERYGVAGLLQMLRESPVDGMVNCMVMPETALAANLLVELHDDDSGAQLTIKMLWLGYRRLEQVHELVEVKGFENVKQLVAHIRETKSFGTPYDARITGYALMLLYTLLTYDIDRRHVKIFGQDDFGTSALAPIKEGMQKSPQNARLKISLRLLLRGDLGFTPVKDSFFDRVGREEVLEPRDYPTHLSMAIDQLTQEERATMCIRDDFCGILPPPGP